jgi:hypothetical protein
MVLFIEDQRSKGNMARYLATLLAATASFAFSAATASAGILDTPAEPRETASSQSAVQRTLEITRATGDTAMQAFALPADFSHWIDRQRGKRVLVGITVGGARKGN